MGEDPPGRLRWCECDRRRRSRSQTRFQWVLLGEPRARGCQVSWSEVDLEQKCVSASLGLQDGRMIYLITFVQIV